MNEKKGKRIRIYKRERERKKREKREKRERKREKREKRKREKRERETSSTRIKTPFSIRIDLASECIRSVINCKRRKRGFSTVDGYPIACCISLASNPLFIFL